MLSNGELSELEQLQVGILKEIAWLRERQHVIQDELDYRLQGDIADMQGRIELLRLRLQELRERLKKGLE